ncbi:TPA: hypothetical protein ACH3X2_14293 [Trebouxia sp. C0005]
MLLKGLFWLPAIVCWTKAFPDDQILDSGVTPVAARAQHADMECGVNVVVCWGFQCIVDWSDFCQDRKWAKSKRLSMRSAVTCSHAPLGIGRYKLSSRRLCQSLILLACPAALYVLFDVFGHPWPPVHALYIEVNWKRDSLSSHRVCLGESRVLVAKKVLGL